jgi:hypothetical protein
MPCEHSEVGHHPAMLERFIDDHVPNIGPRQAPSLRPSAQPSGGQHNCPISGCFEALYHGARQKGVGWALEVGGWWVVGGGRWEVVWPLHTYSQQCQPCVAQDAGMVLSRGFG